MLKRTIGILILLLVLTSPLESFALKELYDLRLIHYTPELTVIVEFNKTNGEAWIVGTDGKVKIKDEKQIPQSIYDVYLTDVPPKQQWQAFRLDKVSGKVWYLVGTTWKEIP